jgi:hypothetical protein
MRANYKNHTIDGVRFPPLQFKIITALLAAGPRGVSSYDLLDYLYGKDPNGGPDTGASCLNSHICYANKRLQRVRMQIKGYCNIKRLESL